MATAGMFPLRGIPRARKGNTTTANTVPTGVTPDTRRSRRAIPMGASTKHRSGSIPDISGAIGHPIEAPMIGTPKRYAFLLGLAALAAASSARVEAQEFRIEEATSLAALAVEGLKPKTITFVDRPGDELIDPDVGLIRFEDWAQAKPLEKQFLTPFPSYLEPTVEATVDGVRKRFKEKLHVYVGEARFALARPPESIDLAGFVSLPFVERIDPAVKHNLITPAEAISAKDPRAAHNQHPLRRWCEARPVTICIHSRYQFEGKLPIGIKIANKLREGAKKIPDYLEFESELTFRPAAEIAEMGLANLTGLDTPPAGALEQNIFYINQVMQFGKLLALFQAHPTDAKQTVVTVFIALAIESGVLAKKKEFVKVPVLRNLVPAQVLAGKSSFNSGNSISAGLPVYARNQVKAIASILERK
jgi:hypothetical protein